MKKKSNNDFLDPEDINIVDIIALGRASSYFFHGLLDSHPEMIALPMFKYPVNSNEKSNPREAALETYKLLSEAYETVMFKKMRSLKKKYLYFFSKYVARYGMTRKNIFIAIYYAYAKSLGLSTANVKYLVFQSHTLNGLPGLIEDFPRRKTIFLARDPRSTMYSFLSSYKWSLYRAAYMTTNFCFKYYRFLKKNVPKNVLVIKHEDLHTNYSSVKKRLIQFLKIKNSPALENATYFGEYYTGTNVNFKSSTGVVSYKPNKKFVSSAWRESLPRFEAKFISFIAKDYIKEFHYPYIKPDSFKKIKTNYRKNFMYVNENSSVAEKSIYYFSKLGKIPFVGTFILKSMVAIMFILWYIKTYILYLNVLRINQNIFQKHRENA